jgi:hypothetical protein
VPHDVERVLADIDADHRDCAIGLLRHVVLLVFAAPGQILLLAGLEDGRTVPLTDMTASPDGRGGKDADPLILRS